MVKNIRVSEWLWEILVVIGIVWLVSQPVFAAQDNVWEKHQLADLKHNLSNGVCGRDGQSTLRNDICKLHGLTEKSKTAANLGKASLSSNKEIRIEAGSQILVLQRGVQPAEFSINGKKLNVAQAKNHQELKDMIMSRLPKQAYSVWITPAYAASLNPQVPAIIQIFIEETLQFGSCDLYLKFADKCIQGLEFVYNEVRRVQSDVKTAAKEKGKPENIKKTSVQQEIIKVEKDLSQLVEQFTALGFPSMESNGSLEYCAKKESREQDVETQKTKLRTCYEMQVGVRDYARASANQDVAESRASLDFLAQFMVNGTATHPLQRREPGETNNEAQATKGVD